MIVGKRAHSVVRESPVNMTKTLTQSELLNKGFFSSPSSSSEGEKRNRRSPHFPMNSYSDGGGMESPPLIKFKSKKAKKGNSPTLGVSLSRDNGLERDIDAMLAQASRSIGNSEPSFAFKKSITANVTDNFLERSHREPESFVCSLKMDFARESIAEAGTVESETETGTVSNSNAIAGGQASFDILSPGGCKQTQGGRTTLCGNTNEVATCSDTDLSPLRKMLFEKYAVGFDDGYASPPCVSAVAHTPERLVHEPEYSAMVFSSGNSDFWLEKSDLDRVEKLTNQPYLSQPPQQYRMTELKPLCITKSMLHDLQFVGQLDNKYILASAQGALVCIDQHAADERVRLEDLNVKYPPKTLVIDQVISVSMEEFLLLQDELGSHSSVLETWGFDFNFDGLVGYQVRLIRTPLIQGESLTADDFLEFLRVISLSENVPRLTLHPPSVDRIFASKACRGAVKFGDQLTPQEASSIMQKLQSCDFPFQCAHGRPSMAPLCELKDLLGLCGSKKYLSHVQFRPNFQNLYAELRHIRHGKQNG